MTGADHEVVVRFLLAALWGGRLVRNGIPAGVMGFRTMIADLVGVMFLL